MKIVFLTLVAVIASTQGATFQSYVLPQSHTSQRVLVEAVPSGLPSEAVAYSAVQALPVPAPVVTYEQLPTIRYHTGTKVTVHHEPIEQHGYIISF